MGRYLFAHYESVPTFLDKTIMEQAVAKLDLNTGSRRHKFCFRTPLTAVGAILSIHTGYPHSGFNGPAWLSVEFTSLSSISGPRTVT